MQCLQRFYCILRANSEDPDQMPHLAASDLGLHCLHMSKTGSAAIKIFRLLFAAMLHDLNYIYLQLICRYVRGPDSSSSHHSPRLPEGYPTSSGDHRPSPGTHPDMYRQQQQHYEREKIARGQEEAVKEASKYFCSVYCGGDCHGQCSR